MAAAPPRPASEEYPWPRRRRDPAPRNIPGRGGGAIRPHGISAVVAAAPPRPVPTEYPRHGRGAAATRGRPPPRRYPSAAKVLRAFKNTSLLESLNDVMPSERLRRLKRKNATFAEYACFPPSLRVEEMGLGDVMLFDYQVLHRGGANRSPKLRTVLYLTRGAGVAGPESVRATPPRAPKRFARRRRSSRNARPRRSRRATPPPCRRSCHETAGRGGAANVSLGTRDGGIKTTTSRQP